MKALGGVNKLRKAVKELSAGYVVVCKVDNVIMGVYSFKPNIDFNQYMLYWKGVKND